MGVQSTAKGEPTRTRIRAIAGAGLIFVLTLLAYIPAYNAGFYSDDETHLVRNERLRTFEGLRQIWSDRSGTDDLYYPLTFTTYWIEHHLWGLDPRGYHIDNVVLHAVNAILVWLVLRRLGVPGAWVAGAVFALHPAHVESVAWVTERRNTLSCLFYLLSIFAYLGFRPLTGPRPKTPRGGSTASRTRVMYALSLTFFLAAMLSKTATLTLPAAILLVTWWKRHRLAWRDVWPLVPFFAVALGLSLLTIGLERKLVQEGGPGWGTFSLADRFLIAGRAVWFYIEKVLFPVNLSFVYPRWSIDARVWWQYLYPASAIALAIVLFTARRRIGKAPLVTFLFFCGTLYPVLGFVDFFYMMMSFVADRFVYLPSVGVIALAVGGAAWGLQRFTPRAANAGPVLSLIVLLVLGAGCWQRGLVFRNAETVYGSVLAKYPDSWVGHYSLGCVLGATQRPEDAIPHLEAALRLNPRFPATRGYLAVVYSQVGRYADAIRMYGEALRQNPNDENILTNLGATYVNMGKYDEAIEEYKKALQVNPRYAPALKNLTRIVLFRIDSLFKEGRTDEARELAGDSRVFAAQAGATDLVRQIDELVRTHVTPRE